MHFVLAATVMTPSGKAIAVPHKTKVEANLIANVFNHTNRDERTVKTVDGSKPAQVNVFMEGGLIQNIELPPGVRVTVYDYDVEGVIDEYQIEKDPKGVDCTIVTWQNAGDVSEGQ